MTGHLSPATLNALADGELSPNQLATANEHLAGCPSCTSSALFQTMLKSAAAKAGQRYAPPPHLQERLTRLAQHETSEAKASSLHVTPASASRHTGRFVLQGWATVAALLLISVSIVLIQRSMQQSRIASTAVAALVNEVSDQHIATLAANSPPQVLSSDRHTVKPWFQGKLPFSFNLPEGLPSDTTLDGANLTYLRNRPVAQLLYRIGKHRVSVFVQKRAGNAIPAALSTEHSGFHVASFSTDDLNVVAVSDADPARLSNLLTAIEHAQTGSPRQSN